LGVAKEGNKEKSNTRTIYVPAGFLFLSFTTMSNSLEDSSVTGQGLAEDDWHFADVIETFPEAAAAPDENDASLIHHHQNDGLLPLSASQPRLRDSFVTHIPIQSTSESHPPVFEMPRQLHPAVSLGVQRVSSCYFSLRSQESMADLLSQFGDNSNHSREEGEYCTNASSRDWFLKSEDVLYHDILMEVFNWLDLPSLCAFSETARRPNFEVFYYLQLQLQQALLIGSGNFTLENTVREEEGQDESLCTNRHSSHSISSIVRLAKLDQGKAQNVVEEYLNSNSTLRTMPLSHSLAYAREYLLHNGFSKMFPNKNNNENSNNKALASAALFMTVVGAASLVSTVSGADATVITDSFGSELPNLLFRVGFMGSIMGAAKKISDTEQRSAMRETAEQMARSMQELPGAFMRGTTERQQQGSNDESFPNSPSQFRLPSLFEMRHTLQTTLRNLATDENKRQPIFPSPYDHLPIHDEEEDADEKKESEDVHEPSHARSPNGTSVVRKVPSGCVGAYSRAIHKSVEHVKQLVKESRKARFQALSAESQRQRSLEFLSACTSDETLDRVKEMVQDIDVDGFFLGSDGSETCALHTAAFHGAEKIVDFLCSGINEYDPRRDGGLCDLNFSDSNGWTALHFAAGANAVSVVRVLVKHGAILNTEANSGYTPLQWALRLSNSEVATELTEHMARAGTEQGAWMSSQPLSSIANRFLSLIPTQ